jgi:hypothetical protein
MDCQIEVVTISTEELFQRRWEREALTLGNRVNRGLPIRLST